MRERKNVNAINEMLSTYRKYLQDEERSRATVERYPWDVKAFVEYLGGRENRAVADDSGRMVDRGRTLDKEAIREYRNYLKGRYKTTSTNSMLAAINSFLVSLGKAEWRVRLLEIRGAQYSRSELKTTEKDYEWLVLTARKNGDAKMSMLIQTIGSTGVRISELKFVTVEPSKIRRAEIYNKGKSRVVLLSVELTRVLEKHCREAGIASGSVFATKHGNPMDRSNVSKKMKQLGGMAGVGTVEIFPHNFRHLLARMFYSIEKDVVRLVDLPGHSNISMTRIYTMTTEDRPRRQMSRMKLVPG